LVHAEEERRRLELENRELQAVENRGFAILQEVISALPSPIIGFDQDGMVAMINEAAAKEFAHRGLVIGVELLAALPELPKLGDNQMITILETAYGCLWRQVSLGGSVQGQLLILQRGK
jgi:PAS domain-containing protein